ncbi:MAG: SPOR domain-containing protein [Gemmatimonadetes bacterium]|nr:SPOR domain-containing protein [Gemmatimonadota bacterium]
MRTRVFFAALVLLVCACGRRERDDVSGAAGALPSAGPDPIVVRVPRDGGVVRAYRYPNLDSLIWRSQQEAPAMERVLSFDAENGLLAYLSRERGPGWLDLRLGTARTVGTARLASITSADGWSIYAVDSLGAIVRLTPTGDWQMKTAGKIRRLFPLVDGTLVALIDRGERSILLRLRPPGDAVGDSLEIPRPDRAVATPLGDRLYLGVKGDLLSVQPRTFDGLSKVSADDEILAIAPTPSGDRVYVANKGGPRLEVMDRYAEDMGGSVRLPGLVTELRMDPMGRYLLARPVTGDSAWVVAIGTDDLVGTVQTEWRPDLPAVTIDGLIATVRQRDVVFVDLAKGAAVRTAPNGADDLWFFTLWNGLRPRAAGIDVAVSFSLGEEGGRNVAADSIRQLQAQRPPSPPDTTADEPAVAVPVAPTPPPSRDAWTVSFAAVLSEQRAREIADAISIDGQRPRIVKGETAGTTVYRVIFGPYNSKADAERMGRASKHNYWVYEGVP